MSMIFTLQEFMSLFGGIDKIHGIYVDTDDDSIRCELSQTDRPLDVLHKHDNLLINDEYLVLENGEYVLNKQKIIDDYNSYIVSLYFPIIPDENVEIAGELEDTLKDDEYLKQIAEYACGCEILIKESLKYNEELEKNFFPEFSSDITGFLITDYRPITDSDEDEEEYYLTTPLGMMSNMDDVKKVIAKRKLFYTSVYTITNGVVNTEEINLFYTDEHGIITDLGELEEGEEKDD